MTKDTANNTNATRTIARDGRVLSRLLRNYRLELRGPSGSRALDVHAETYRIGSRPGADLVLDDQAVSRVHCEILIEDDGYRLRDLGSTNGTFVDGFRVRDIYLRPGATIGIGASELTFQPSERETEVPLSPGERFGHLVGASVAMRQLFATLERVAAANVTVLIEGESGTGKELVARSIHDASPRRSGPFVVFDCASVPSNLLESELFGHEKGSFSGASGQRIGRMEEADGGTLFIDELGELPLDLQPKLLRILESRRVSRIGSNKEIDVDVRVVAATHRDLLAMVNSGSFREDLFYRLAVVQVKLPPLRARADDLPVLVRHLVERALTSDPARAQRVCDGISQSTWQRLKSHPWPGNIRELRNVIERTLVLTHDGETAQFSPAQPAYQAARQPEVRTTSHAGHAPAPLATGARAIDADAPLAIDLSRPFADQKADVLAAFEAAYLWRQLDRHDGNISRAAAASGLDRMYFKRLLRKYER